MDQQNVENDLCLNQDNNRWSIYSNSSRTSINQNLLNIERNNNNNNENSNQQPNQNLLHTVLREIAKAFKDVTTG
ncbi:7996_t:CDS:1, partial [Cetraspora pellucida]